jgi:hypothetical protein
MKKEDIHLDDLPAAMHNVFRNWVIPQLREFMGTVAPWQNPREEDIRNVWAYCSSKEISHLDDETFFILGKLVRHLTG